MQPSSPLDAASSGEVSTLQHSHQLVPANRDTGSSKKRKEFIKSNGDGSKKERGCSKTKRWIQQKNIGSSKAPRFQHKLAAVGCSLAMATEAPGCDGYGEGACPAAGGGRQGDEHHSCGEVGAVRAPWKELLTGGMAVPWLTRLGLGGVRLEGNQWL